MARADHQESRVEYLLELLCDERLLEHEAVELAQLLATSEIARQRYVETVQLCVALADCSHPTDTATALQKAVGGIPASNGYSAALHAGQHDEEYNGNSLADSVSVRNHSQFEHSRRLSWQPFLTVAAMLMLCATLWTLSQFFGASGEPPAGSDGNSVAHSKDQHPNHWADDESCKYVARVVEVTADAQWESDRQPREFFMRLRIGDQLQLRSGLAHLEFYSGASIILQGPCKFTPTGRARGELASGRLTGKVDGGKFWLTTPTAKVIDLGTEFGVTVGPTSDTDVCVFDGEVQVRPDVNKQDNQQASSEAYNLTQGMSVRVAATGKVSDGLYAGVEYESYTRNFPAPAGSNPGELDLVDIVCGGNGQGARLAAAIDPLTGQWDRRPWNNSLGPGTRHGDRIFHAADWHPFIDGTFVPNQYGEPSRVDTVGGTIVLPKDRGHYTWGPIWARRAVKDKTQMDRSADSWGAQTYPVITERLSRCRLGGIGIHSSVGITFDLHAIGKVHPGEINRFQGAFANLENSKDHNPEWANANPPPTADFRVFVDGQMRFEKLDFARNLEGVPFDVDLSSGDRFLTLISTDGGNSNRYDHVVIIDPVLELEGSHRTLGTITLEGQGATK
jgi:hypothetical protein